MPTLAPRHRSPSFQANSQNALGLSVPPHAKSNTLENPDTYLSHRMFNGVHDIERRSRGLDSNLDVGADVGMNMDMDIHHTWQKARPGDSRSPCPALNAAANHGYLPRDGRRLTMWSIIKGLKECYRISWALAAFLTVGSFILLRMGGIGQGWLVPTIDLEDYCAHNILEHNASLTHRDVDEAVEAEEKRHWTGSRPRSSSESSMAGFHPADPSLFSFNLLALTPSHLKELVRALPAFFISIVLSLLPIISDNSPPSHRRQNNSSPTSDISSSSRPSHNHACAPNRPSTTLINRLFADSASGTHLTLKDIARARTRRLEECAKRSTTTPHHLSHFADSEFCLTLGVFSPNQGEMKVELARLREWLEDERLPTGWMPSRDLGLWENHENTTRLQSMMHSFKQYRTRGRDVKTVVFD